MMMTMMMMMMALSRRLRLEPLRRQARRLSSTVRPSPRIDTAGTQSPTEVPPPPSAAHPGHVLPVVVFPSEVLRVKARRIPEEDIASAWVQELARDLRATASFHDALGLAAPQVGAAVRMLVIRRPYFMLPTGVPRSVRSFEVCINPEVEVVDARQRLWLEGCLSLPDCNVAVMRATSVVARYMDETGARHKRVLTSLPAVSFQHEVEHLDGVVMTDLGAPVSPNMSQPNDPAWRETIRAARRLDEGLHRWYGRGGRRHSSRGVMDGSVPDDEL